MKIVTMVRRIGFTLALWAIAPSLAYAYVDVELDSGRHVIGQYYNDQGGKLTVYRPSGAIEIDRARVRSIQEPQGDMPSEVVGTVSDAPASNLPTATSPKGGTASAPRATDPDSRERELSHRLIDMRLDRLAATQRGDDEATKKLDKQIKSLQSERETNWKKLHPSDEHSSE